MLNKMLKTNQFIKFKTIIFFKNQKSPIVNSKNLETLTAISKLNFIFITKS